MSIDPRYSFVPTSGKTYYGLSDKKIQNLLQKWGVKLQTQHFLFNEPFFQYHKYQLAEAFFKNEVVGKHLKTWTNNSFESMGFVASDIEVKQIPCTVMSMSFFDKLTDSKNNIVHESGSLHQRSNIYIDGILVADNLRAMILDNECNEFNLYSEDERKEFIFCLFQLLVLGGEYCQYEDDLKSYLEVTKTLYKDFISITKRQDNTFISTIVLQVVAKTQTPYFPKDPEHKQNVGFLLINGDNREITTLLHQYSGY